MRSPNGYRTDYKELSCISPSMWSGLLFAVYTEEIHSSSFRPGLSVAPVDYLSVL